MEILRQLLEAGLKNLGNGKFEIDRWLLNELISSTLIHRAIEEADKEEYEKDIKKYIDRFLIKNESETYLDLSDELILEIEENDKREIKMTYQEAKKELLNGKVIRRKMTTERGPITLTMNKGLVYARGFRQRYNQVDLKKLEEDETFANGEWEIVE